MNKFTFSLIFAISLFFPITSLSNDNSVIFFHPDGMGVNTWTAIRNHKVGPDGELNWDKIEDIAIYKGHVKDALTATSHSGATIHAYGIKVQANSFGQDGGDKITSASGKPFSILIEAQKAGKAIGLINSGTVSEPGTAAFAASVGNRKNHAEIVAQLIENNVDVIFGGGEEWFLPEGIEGKYGEGKRSDGRNLINEAKDKGYKVILSREELLNLDVEANKGFKILGLFAAYHTFNDESEEKLAEEDLPLFNENSPTIAEMTDIAIKFLDAKGENGFFLASEEEATDNFGNFNNASGVIEAGERADETIGIILEYIEKNPNLSLITTSDSDAGGMQVMGFDSIRKAIYSGMFGNSVSKDTNGAPIDGVNGENSNFFLSPADKAGIRHPFLISWASSSDISSGIVIKAAGKNAETIKGTMDNTEIFQFIRGQLIDN